MIDRTILNLRSLLLKIQIKKCETVKEGKNWELLFQHNYLPKDYNLNYMKKLL